MRTSVGKHVSSPHTTSDRDLPMQHGDSETSTLSDMTRQRITLDGPELLRATNACHLLTGCGKLLHSSAGDAGTFSLSVPVRRIAEFVSHNWSTQRLEKFLVLALHFNLSLGLTWASAVVFLLSILVAAEVLPMIECRNPHSDINVPKTPYCTTACPIVLLIVIVFGRDIVKPFGFKGPQVFFDKTCIHQTDFELQKRGILALAAVLMRSDSLTIVYEETYLKKLWTTYEIATALALRPQMRLVMLPVLLPKVVFTISALMPLHILRSFIRFCCGKPRLDIPVPFSPHTPTAFVSTVFAYWLVSWLLRIWARRCGDMSAAVDKFDIRTATCFVESDRLLIQTSICSFMRDCHGVASEARDDDALDAFNVLVRQKVPGALRASNGPVGLRYRFVAASLASGWMGATADFIASYLRAGVPLSQTLVTAIGLSSWFLFFWPIMFAVCSMVVQSRLRLSGCLEQMMLLVLAILCAVVHLHCEPLWQRLSFLALFTWGHSLLFTSITGAGALCTYWMYRPRKDYHANGCKLQYASESESHLSNDSGLETSSESQVSTDSSSS